MHGLRWVFLTRKGQDHSITASNTQDHPQVQRDVGDKTKKCANYNIQNMLQILKKRLFESRSAIGGWCLAMCVTLITHSTTSLSTSASKMQGTCNGKSSTSPLRGMSPIDVSQGLLNGDVELFPLHVPCIFEADVDRVLLSR